MPGLPVKEVGFSFFVRPWVQDLEVFYQNVLPYIE